MLTRRLLLAAAAVAALTAGTMNLTAAELPEGGTVAAVENTGRDRSRSRSCRSRTTCSGSR